MLKIENINKTFYSGMPEEHKLFNNFNLTIQENKCTAILGPNGCGKSTLINMISGSLPLDNGSISLKGTKISDLVEEKRSNYIGKVNQDPSKGVSLSLNILENMSISLKKGEKFSFSRLLKKKNKEFIVSKLKELDLGLENKLNTQVRFLSGGQRQALSLLMATIKRPELLLLDEHTAALDPKTSKLIMEKTIDLIKREKITTIMITHNLRHALEYSDRIIMLNKGEIILDIDSTAITEDELNSFYNNRILTNISAAS
ncbi:MAG: ATP-binding cassette domain-containing protein [Tissierellia bacterium]|nr:ATP-binding cassette domain-containing protein [Tissierellia bacterium]